MKYYIVGIADVVEHTRYAVDGGMVTGESKFGEYRGYNESYDVKKCTSFNSYDDALNAMTTPCDNPDFWNGMKIVSETELVALLL